jgi:chloramphenicol O-acetyltransferase type A
MRIIDLETWPRRKHYEWLKAYEMPHFNMCANMDITAFKTAVKERSVSFTIAVVYLIARTANDVPEFRQRIRGDEVVEHETVHPSTTYLTEGDLFSFCHMPYEDDFSVFAQRAERNIEFIRENPTIKDEPGRDDLLFLTSIPWVSFTGFMHPMRLNPDSVPRIAWGKFFQEDERLKMPVSVQAHHALVDGVHMGRYFEIMQEYLDHPESYIFS